MIRLLMVGCFAFVPLVCRAEVAAKPNVRLELSDGRFMEGRLDDATDSRYLWLRRDAERIVLANSYRWDEIARVIVDGKEVETEDLLASASKYATSWPDSFLFVEYEGAQTRRAHASLAPARERPRAVACSFAATLANWDRDIEPDGYEIAVTVTDQYGYPVAVRGTLSATLIGERVSRAGDRPIRGELERWSERISPRQFDAGPAILRLPFRQLRPELDLEVEPWAVLQIEVGAFGDGRFASSATVPIREYNPLRDRLQQQTGSRFFRGELIQRPSR